MADIVEIRSFLGAVKTVLPRGAPDLDDPEQFATWYERLRRCSPSRLSKAIPAIIDACQSFPTATQLHQMLWYPKTPLVKREVAVRSRLGNCDVCIGTGMLAAQNIAGDTFAFRCSACDCAVQLRLSTSIPAWSDDMPGKWCVVGRY